MFVCMCSHRVVRVEQLNMPMYGLSFCCNNVVHLYMYVTRRFSTWVYGAFRQFTFSYMRTRTCVIYLHVRYLLDAPRSTASSRGHSGNLHIRTFLYKFAFIYMWDTCEMPHVTSSFHSHIQTMGLSFILYIYIYIYIYIYTRTHICSPTCVYVRYLQDAPRDEQPSWPHLGDFHWYRRVGELLLLQCAEVRALAGNVLASCCAHARNALYACYVYVYVCVYVYMYVYIIYTHMHTQTHVYMYSHTYTRMCTRVCLCTCM
jgi:hypothetical protein